MMIIPHRLNELLAMDSGLNGAVLCTIDSFEPWLLLNRVVFFPEYTDHGIKHIESVLMTECALISDAAWEVLTPDDAATLILATLLHDVGMHLSVDGFAQLIASERQSCIGFEVDDKPWAELWSDYLREASRFDGRTLKQLFGEPEPVSPPNLGNLDQRGHLLVGEFLRRHHARLSHEIALWGVPGPGTTPIGLSNAVTQLHAHMIGLVARSHGMPLRTAIKYLEKQPFNNTREWCGVHAIFLMCLLRVADYLQIQSDRAPKAILKITRLRSPVSQREWDVHQCVQNTSTLQFDPELLYVDASPASVSIFLRLRQWLDGVQYELDSCWAVLGEVYGRFSEERLDQFGLRLRRVRSSIDEASFANCVSYAPRLARFTADAELPQLLVRPLYGNKPEVGIRELMQNALDAVHEMRHYLEEHPDQRDETDPIEGDVVISVEQSPNGKWRLSVADRGIGMTEDTICNYFLRAGASYRRSDAWRDSFESAPNESRVLRSGRFGIGAMAAFLLGDTVSVSTRHVSSPREKGVTFETTISNEAIQLNYATRSVGTTVSIEISKQLADRLFHDHDSWDWYCLDQPSVVRRHANSSLPLPQSCLLPKAEEAPPSEWRRTEVPKYLDVKWRLSGDMLVCNGIRIRGIRPAVRIPSLKEVPNIPFDLHPISVSVFDPNGLLPLTLNRDRLAGSGLPFEMQIRDDLLCDFLAYLLVNGPTQLPTSKGGTLWLQGILGFGQLAWMLRTQWRGPIGFMGTVIGFGLIEPWALKTARVQRLALLPYSDLSDDRIASLSLSDNSQAFALLQHKVGLTGFGRETPPMVEWVNLVLGRDQGWTRGDPKPLWEFASGRRAIFPRTDFSTQDAAGTRFAAACQRLDDNWSLIAEGTCGDSSLIERTVEAAEVAGGDRQQWVLGEWFFDSDTQAPDPSPLMRLWKEIIQEPLIPYCPRDRREKLAHAFKTLAPYIEKYEEAKMT